MKNLENKIIKINTKELLKLSITEIHISIKDFAKLKCVDDDGDAPLGWLLNCLNAKDKDLVIEYLLKCST